MKKLLQFIILFLSFSVCAQVTNEGEPRSWHLIEKSTNTEIELPGIDIEKIRYEDKINDTVFAKPYRIGVPIKVNYGLDNSGTWTQLPNGDRLWKVGFESKDAIHLSVAFNEFYIPKGADIYVYSADQNELIGAYSSLENNDERKLSTWFLKSDNIWIEYYEPKEVKDEGNLNISSVVHGYRLGDDYQKGYVDSINKSLNDSGACNHDVDCPIGTDFETQRDLLKHSVAFLNMGDGYICSGALVNNTNQDKTPYFLTANHCYDRDAGEDPADPSIFSMRFNWISPNPVCAEFINSTDGPTTFVMSGSTLRARSSASDVMLLELTNDIPTDWNVTYAGWDRSDLNPTFQVGIHHPRGDIMKISRDNDSAVKINVGGVHSWVIDGIGATGSGDGWEIGVTEGGSSGSPLFDQNGRIIGQLLGGNADCSFLDDNDEFDAYGRFAISWDNGITSATRLMDWLDPLGTNPNTLDALQNVLAVNDEFLDQNIAVFPNPTSGVIQIKVSGLVGNLNYNLYNVMGQTLLSGSKLHNNEIIDFGSLTNAVYFLKITETDSNRTTVKKIVLSR